MLFTLCVFFSKEFRKSEATVQQNMKIVGMMKLLRGYCVFCVYTFDCVAYCGYYEGGKFIGLRVLNAWTA